MSRVLTREQVIHARTAVANGATIRSVAADLDQNYPAVAGAVAGRTWRSVDPVAAPVKRNLVTSRTRYTPEQRAALIDRTLSMQADYPGLTVAAVARRLDVRPATLTAWVRDHRRAQG